MKTHFRFDRGIKVESPSWIRSKKAKRDIKFRARVVSRCIFECSDVISNVGAAILSVEMRFRVWRSLHELFELVGSARIVPVGEFDVNKS